MTRPYGDQLDETHYFTHPSKSEMILSALLARYCQRDSCLFEANLDILLIDPSGHTKTKISAVRVTSVDLVKFEVVPLLDFQISEETFVPSRKHRGNSYQLDI